MRAVLESQKKVGDGVCVHVLCVCMCHGGVCARVVVLMCTCVMVVCVHVSWWCVHVSCGVCMCHGGVCARVVVLMCTCAFSCH